MKTVVISFDWWEAVIRLSDNIENLMKSQLLFWMDGQQRIDREGGDIEQAYLKMLGEELIKYSMEYNFFGILNKFEDKEGWCPLDGSEGIQLMSINNWEFSQDDFYIETRDK